MNYEGALGWAVSSRLEVDLTSPKQRYHLLAALLVASVALALCGETIGQTETRVASVMPRLLNPPVRASALADSQCLSPYHGPWGPTKYHKMRRAE